MQNKRLIDLTGKNFGDWIVVKKCGNARGGAALWLCHCACGTERPVVGSDLRNGKSKGCGCSARSIGDIKRTHGATGTRLHTIWKGMRARCNSSNPLYGGRGVAVCSEWDDFATFAAWAAESGYQDDLSIERIDNDAGYSPSNCKWATPKEQSVNRRFIRKIGGKPGFEVAEENGIPAHVYRWRVNHGWPIEQAASHPMGKRRH